MRRETYLKIKKQKRRAKLLGILATLSLVGCAIKDKLSNDEMGIIDINNETNLSSEPIKIDYIEIVDKNGVILPGERGNFKETTYDAFARMSMQLYDSYKSDKKVVGSVAEYEVLNITHTNEEYSYVITKDGQTGYVFNNIITILPDDYIEVDLSEQKVYIVYNNENVYNFNVVTGAPGHETDIGYTEIWAKNYNRKLSGPGYSRDVKYAFFFNDDEEAFHDASWRNEFGGEIYKTNGSLGCVNSDLEDVEILDIYTEVGTKVVVHR